MQFTAHIASHMEFSHSKQWKEFEVSVTEGVEETNHTGGTKESGDMTMDDRGGKPNMGFDEQGVTLQNMDTQDIMLPSISPTEPLFGRGHRTKQPSTRLQDYVTNTTLRSCPNIAKVSIPSFIFMFWSRVLTVR